MSFGRLTGSKEYDHRAALLSDVSQPSRKRFFPQGHVPIVEKPVDSGLPPFYDIKTRFSATPKSSFETTSRVLVPDESSCQYAPMSQFGGSKLSFQQEDKLRRQRRIEAKSQIRNAHLQHQADVARSDQLQRERREAASIKTKQDLARRYHEGLH